MAEATARRGRMIHRRRTFYLPDVTGNAALARNADIVPGEPLDVRRKSGRHTKGPAQENDGERENHQGTHRAAAHRTAITCPRSLDIKGSWGAGRSAGWLRR